MDKIKMGQGIPFDPIDPDPEPPKKNPVKEKNNGSKDDFEKEFSPEKKKSSPILTVILVLFALFALSAAAAFYVAKENETKKLLETQAELEKVLDAKAQIKRDLDDTIVVKQQLEMDLDRSKENYRKLLTDFQEQQSENEKLVEKYSGKMKQIATLKSQLENESKENKKMSFRLDQINKEFDDLKSQLTQIRKAKEALEKRMIKLSRRQERPNSVELDTIVVDKTNPEQPLDAQPQVVQAGEAQHFTPLPDPAKLEGQILVVNKEFAFVVINLGQKDGLKGSEVLQVYRGTKAIGKVQIERIYDTMSSAVIVPEKTGQEIAEGDIVKLI